MQELTAALSAALDPEGVGAAIIERAMPALGANAGNVFLSTTPRASCGMSPCWGTSPRSRNGHDDCRWTVRRWWPRWPVPASQSSCPPGRSESRATRITAVHAKGGDRAVAGLPLQVEGRTVGALSLAFPSDRAFDDDDRRFMARSPISAPRRCSGPSCTRRCAGVKSGSSWLRRPAAWGPGPDLAEDGPPVRLGAGVSVAARSPFCTEI